MTFKSALLAGGLLLAGAGAANAAIVQSDLNLRSGPGTAYRVISVMPAGADVDVLGCSGSWCRIAWGAAEGYASASYLAGGPAYAVAPPPVVVAPPLFSFGVGTWDYGWGGNRGWHRYRGWNNYRGWHGGHRAWRGGHGGWRGGGHRGHR
ncbi:MAG TPA: SH3 domain-containing protein [Pseudolabrys sp.]|nr:SH3 domain-containing protein [Pseudolabrys sp.]